MTDSPTLKRLQQEHPEWCFQCGSTCWPSIEGHICHVSTGLSKGLVGAILELERKGQELCAAYAISLLKNGDIERELRLADDFVLGKTTVRGARMAKQAAKARAEARDAVRPQGTC